MPMRRCFLEFAAPLFSVCLFRATPLLCHALHFVGHPRVPPEIAAEQRSLAFPESGSNSIHF